MNIAGVLDDAIARAGDRLALVQGSRALAYRALGDRVARLAAGLAGLGLRRGDRIVLLMPNRPELVESLWAAFHGGFVAVPVNWHLHPDEVDYIVRNCGAAAVVVSDETTAATRPLPDAVRVLRVGRGGLAITVVHGRHRDGSRLALLHVRDNREAEGGDAHPPQPRRNEPGLPARP